MAGAAGLLQPSLTPMSVLEINLCSSCAQQVRARLSHLHQPQGRRACAPAAPSAGEASCTGATSGTADLSYALRRGRLCRSYLPPGAQQHRIQVQTRARAMRALRPRAYPHAHLRGGRLTPRKWWLTAGQAQLLPRLHLVDCHVRALRQPPGLALPLPSGQEHAAG